MKTIYIIVKSLILIEMFCVEVWNLKLICLYYKITIKFERFRFPIIFNFLLTIIFDYRYIKTKEYKEIIEQKNGDLKAHNLTSAGFGLGIQYFIYFVFKIYLFIG